MKTAHNLSGRDGADGAEDAAFIAAFEAGRLVAFPHADHVRLAWCYLRRMPLLAVLTRFRDGLQRFAAQKGHPELYHETLTVAFVLLIHTRMSGPGPPASDWPAFAQHHPDLLEWPCPALQAYYTAETLDSEAARRHFVLPDQQPA